MLGCRTLPLEIDLFAIVLMESFGVICFLMGFVFIKDFQKLSGRIESLKEALAKTGTTGEAFEEERCYSYKWVMNQLMKPKKAIAPKVYFPLLIWGATGVIAFAIFAVFLSAGYSLLIALVGTAVFLETDVFEARSYGKAVQKITLNQLNKEDQSYMEIAKEALKVGSIRFLLAGATFAIAGPFIPVIFDGISYVLVSYTGILFQATETAQNVSKALALLIALILPGILLYLPELLGRVIYGKTKVAIRKRKKPKVE